jgi:hypothetical protein
MGGHSALAIAIVLLYACFFVAVARNDHLAVWGVFAGGVHGLLGGVVVGAFVDLHPRMPHAVAAPASSTPLRGKGRRDGSRRAPVVGLVLGTLYALLHDRLSPAAVL